MNIFKRILSAALILCIVMSLSSVAMAAALYKQGDSGKEITKIKDRMYELGYYTSKPTNVQFNSTMVERVKQLQKANGLKQTGEIDQALYDLIFSDDVLQKNGRKLGTLQEGDSGGRVLALKERMQQLQYFASTAKLNDVFNEGMTTRVKELQKVNGFEQTGKVTTELYEFIMSSKCLNKSGTQPGTLAEGSSGDKVYKLKKRMQELLYFSESTNISSSFTESTATRVKQLQKVNGFEETGIVTPELYDYIMSSKCLNKNGLPVGALAEGDSGDKVLKLKKRMQALRYFESDSSINNSFTETTTQRVKLLQETNGLEPTGIVTKELYDFIMSKDCLKCGDWHNPYYNVEARLNYELDGEKLFSLSESGNVVVFVLDFFANNYMKSLLRAYPKAMDPFKDFTYYTNCDPRYIGTYPSITHMLTGVDFDPDMLVAQWFEYAWQQPSANHLYDSIHQLGYKFHYYYYSAISNGMKAEAVGKVDNLIDLTQPGHKTPKPIYSYDNFLTQLEARGLTADKTEDKYIQMIHLRGAHAPYTVDANGRYKEDASREETIAGYLKMVKVYMDEMKRLGLYDDATIIITADHGDKNGNMQVVYFIKQPGETHDKMVENAAPISHDDFPGTLLALIGGDYSKYGTSIFDWKKGDKRQRTCAITSRDANLYPLGSCYSDKGVASHNEWKIYTYTGDGDDLMKLFKRGKYKSVPLKQSFN
ncbi:MAG: peptidoglycan-binding protein [Clostridia bacterium]|nr:peptidoglycan-binding protein [Clostridia bacterium]